MMASKNIAIRKDVYDSLRREQRSGESFSKLLARLIQQGGSPVEVGGSWPTAGLAHWQRRLLAMRGASGGGGRK